VEVLIDKRVQANSDESEITEIQHIKPDLNISTLRIFVMTLDMTFSKAAALVGRSEWRASVRMKQLEQQVGQKLFRHKGRRLVLTDAGQVLMAYARRILALNDEALRSLRSGEYVDDALWLRLNSDPRQSLPRIRTLESQTRQTRDRNIGLVISDNGS
jgi:DNA-binding transcriptional LysR family regulator